MESRNSAANVKGETPITKRKIKGENQMSKSTTKINAEINGGKTAETQTGISKAKFKGANQRGRAKGKIKGEYQRGDQRGKIRSVNHRRKSKLKIKAETQSAKSNRKIKGENQK